MPCDPSGSAMTRHKGPDDPAHLGFRRLILASCRESSGGFLGDVMAIGKSDDTLRRLVEADNHPGFAQEEESRPMCDYSLHHVATRPARTEDTLVTTKFSNSITRGFAAVGEPHVAVCLLPGTEIAFAENVECEPSFGIGILPNKKIGQRLARFRQINMDNPVTHHDALEFPDVVLLTRLCQGQRATVLQLPMPHILRPQRKQRSERFASLRFWPEPVTYRRDREPPAHGGSFPSCTSA